MIILLSLLPKCRDYRHVLPYPVTWWLEPRLSHMLGKQSAGLHSSLKFYIVLKCPLNFA